MAIQHLQGEDGDVIRVGERQARALVESGRFSYLTGAVAETQAPRKTTAKKATKKATKKAAKQSDKPAE
jgi:hypothetical protein